MVSVLIPIKYFRKQNNAIAMSKFVNQRIKYIRSYMQSLCLINFINSYVQSLQAIQCSRGKVITDCIIKMLCSVGMGEI